MRINQYLAKAGLCSRRQAEEYILQGLVKINQKTVKNLAQKVVVDQDEVQLQGQKLELQKNIYILLNKPKHCLTTTHDPKGRKTVMDLVELSTRVFPVGRLDKDTTGLLLLTNDGALAQILSHPRYQIPKVYHVKLNKPLLPRDEERIQNGVQLEDGVAWVDKLQVKKEDRRKITLTIHIGKNRIVRRLFEALGYSVRHLDRVVYANLDKKNLPRGKWRYLTRKEIKALKSLAKLPVEE